VFAEKPVAIIDIGSNSVRLVVYSGATRIPSIIFNEKVLAGLGREVGAIDAKAEARALAALDRFRLLIDQMGVVRTRVVATAAVREASNGAAFLDRVRKLGFEPRLLSGEAEGEKAGQGVISAIPDADGIVGDLGGGSLELAEVSGGRVGARASLPLGVLRLDALGSGMTSFAKKVAKQVRTAGFEGAAAGRPFYLVGGSWRTLARLDMALTGHPLPITHQHEMAAGRPRELKDALATLDKSEFRDIPSVSLARFPTLPNANALLGALVKVLEPGRLIVSSFGIREGLLYTMLNEEEQRQDPLLAACDDLARRRSRSVESAHELCDWTDDLFRGSGPPETAEQRRLRHAACLLSDIGWHAHPDYRGVQSLNLVAHGNFVGVDHAGRAFLALTVYYRNEGTIKDELSQSLVDLVDKDMVKRARILGAAFRAAHMVSAAMPGVLPNTPLSYEGNRLVWNLPEPYSSLDGERVDRRFKDLASLLDREAEIRVGPSFQLAAS